MIDRVRYFLAVLNLIVLPPGLLFWFLIHPWVRWWRKLGPIQTYLIVFPVMGILGALLYRFRGSLLGTDYGTNWIFIAVAVVMYGMMTRLELQYWKHLSFATLAGIHELSSEWQPEGRLLQDGIYRVVRHPRYLSAGIGIVASSLLINYAGLYMLILLSAPLGYLMILLEERELIDRFGEEYRKYQREVPRFIPHRRKTR